jgi:hypothetical protein
LGYMRSFLINTNLSFYYWLRKKIGKKKALRIAKSIETVVLIFGREKLPGEASSGGRKHFGSRG